MSEEKSLPESLLLSVACLRERLAEDIRVLYLGDISTVADYFVIATGTSNPHLRALSEDLDIRRKEARLKSTRKGGDPQSGWVILDFGDVVVHIMTPSLRDFYALEQLWSDAKTVDVPHED